MSYVTNVILHFGIIEEEDEKIKEVNAFFDKRAYPHERPLVGLHEQPLPDGWYGGTKYLECHIYVGAFNWFDLDGFIKHLGTIQWESPEDVQVFVKDEHDTRFKLMYGVSEYDNRFEERDSLLCEAQDWLEDLAKIVTDSYELGQLKQWQEQYKKLYLLSEES